MSLERREGGRSGRRQQGEQWGFSGNLVVLRWDDGGHSVVVDRGGGRVVCIGGGGGLLGE